MNIYENTSSSARYENLPALPTATGQEVVYCYGVYPPCLPDAICRSLGRPSFLETLYFGVVPAFVTLTFVIDNNPIKTKGLTVHAMDKYSLEEIL